MTRVDWKRVLKIVVYVVIPALSRVGVKPTLRTVFYALVSRNIIPNTKSAYKRLSEVLVKARKQGVLPWDFLEGRERYTIKRFCDYRPTMKELESIEDACKQKVENIDLNKLLSYEFDYLIISSGICIWADQPVIPEVWVEKDSLATTICNWVADLSVNIRVNRGYSPWTFIYENIKEIISMLDNHRKVVVLYCGDLDPSCVDIQRFHEYAVEYLGINRSELEIIRVAVTPDQVEKYNLPPRPEDVETIAKTERDTRSNKYTYDHIVELDALMAFAPHEFKKLLRDSILKYHDKEIYNKVKREAIQISQKSKEIVEKYKKEALRKIAEQAKELLS